MLPERWKIRITRQEILDWFNKGCNSPGTYGSHHIDGKKWMYYPNYKTFDGFLRGDHLLSPNQTRSGYEEISEAEFMKYVFNGGEYYEIF